MPFETILLMTPADCGDMLTRILASHAGERRLRPIATLEALMAIEARDLADARLVSFTNPWIVPAHILAALGYGAYNFHPGPPHYPGLARAQMAIYEDAALFGITVHHMIAAVDAGPIVLADLCVIPPAATTFDLEVRAFALLAKAFHALGPRLTQDPRPLPAIPVTWGMTKSSRRQLHRLCALTPDLSPEDIDRRIRAFAGNGFGIDVTMEVHGHRFCLSGAPRAVAAGFEASIAGVA